jgi:hypothetical protein
MSYLKFAGQIYGCCLDIFFYFCHNQTDLSTTLAYAILHHHN